MNIPKARPGRRASEYLPLSWGDHDPEHHVIRGHISLDEARAILAREVGLEPLEVEHTWARFVFATAEQREWGFERVFAESTKATGAFAVTMVRRWKKHDPMPWRLCAVRASGVGDAGRPDVAELVVLGDRHLAKVAEAMGSATQLNGALLLIDGVPDGPDVREALGLDSRHAPRSDGDGSGSGAGVFGV